MFPSVPSCDIVEIPEYLPTSTEKRKQILDLECRLQSAGGTAFDLPVIHWFCNGLYARELFIPAGTVLTGKIHKTEHLVIVSMGVVTVATEFETKLIEAPHTMITIPGTKRALFVHEDVIWTNIHATNERDVTKIEEDIIAKTYADVDFDEECSQWRG